jgi:hypothetical protein
MSFTIDVHHHFLPDVFWRATNDVHSPVGGILRRLGLRNLLCPTWTTLGSTSP